MKILEVRRHSFRKQGGGSQLSQEGVDYARALGATIGPFARVVTSVVPRARETAIAMGFAVDEELVTLASDRMVYEEAARHRWWETPYPFVALAEIIGRDGAYSRYAHSMVALWRDILTPLDEGAAALFIGHSGEIEAALVACFPEADYVEWGPIFGPCEGVRLVFDGDPAYFADLQFLRTEV